MKPPKAHSLSALDAEHAIAALTLAFSTDPVIRSFYPDPLDHLTHFCEMMRISIAPAIVLESAYYVDGFSAAAVWFPPSNPDTEHEAKKVEGWLGALIAETALREGNEDLFVALDEMDEYHPKEPHWYLFSIGVDPHHQNEGLGSLLMEHVLPKSDADGTLASGRPVS